MTTPLQTGLAGIVIGYDDHAGFGAIESQGAKYFLHCTQIADGSRHIDVGQRVSFRVSPGLRGRWEALDVRSR